MLAAAWASVLLLAVSGSAAGSGSAQAATPHGVYAGGGNPAAVAAFGDWLGKPPEVALDYLEWTSWVDIAQPTWLLDQWEAEPYSLVLSVPMLPNDGSTLLQGASGAYDHHFTQLAQNLVARGLEATVVRLGWEFNHEWFPWYAGADTASFVTYWRRIADAMRAVEGANFTFEWSANLGGGLALETAYPGDAYVDTIGLDVYNHDWHPGWQDPVTRWSNLRSKDYGLNWHRDFAAAHGKQVTFPEWGMIVRTDGHGGGDDPYFVERMHEWIEQGDTAFHVYFDLDTDETTNSMTKGWFPQGARRYRELFTMEPPPPGAPAGPAGRTPATPVGTKIASAGAAAKSPLRVHAVIRRLKRQLRISVAARGSVGVRRIDVFVDGRRVCRARNKKLRCSRRKLAPGRHRIVVRVHDARYAKTTLARVVRVGKKIRKPVVLRN